MLMRDAETSLADHYYLLYKVMELLCKLDNLPNIINLTNLFEQENGEPIYQ